jgi:hypothetical protein
MKPELIFVNSATKLGVKYKEGKCFKYGQISFSRRPMELVSTQFSLFGIQIISGQNSGLTFCLEFM